MKTQWSLFTKSHPAIATILQPALPTETSVTPAQATSAGKTKPQFRLNFRAYLILKRLIDIVVSVAVLIVLAPLMLLITILIRLDSPGPAIFAQERVGSRVRGKGDVRSWEMTEFTVYKFRTMYQNASSDKHKAFVQALIQKDDRALDKLQEGKAEGASKYKMVNDNRITRVGAFLRKTSLDELPQFWNVLRGDMTLVGPRPPIAYEVEMYSAKHLERLAAKPGLTGVWQVTSRSAVDFDGMVALDVWYIEHQSLWLDVKILFQTPVAVLSRKGAV